MQELKCVARKNSVVIDKSMAPNGALSLIRWLEHTPTAPESTERFLGKPGREKPGF